MADEKFVPTFYMPVIAPAPEGYAGDAAAYYAEVAIQSFVTLEDVLIPPEATVVTDPPETKGLKITIPSPGATSPAPFPFGTVFAIMGGWLTYVRATPDALAGSAVDLVPSLPPPFNGVTPPPQYPAPAGLDPPATPWGALVLRLWGIDFQKLTETLQGSPACNAVYYLGVDEASVQTALTPLVKLHFRRDHYDQSVANHEKPVFQDVVEEIKGQLYATTPTPYDDLVNDFLIAMLNGNTSLLVKGGAPIGEAVRVIDISSGTGVQPAVGKVELWLLDGGEPPQFISSTQIFKGAPTYEF